MTPHEIQQNRANRSSNRKYAKLTPPVSSADTTAEKLPALSQKQRLAEATKAPTLLLSTRSNKKKRKQNPQSEDLLLPGHSSWPFQWRMGNTRAAATMYGNEKWEDEDNHNEPCFGPALLTQRKKKSGQVVRPKSPIQNNDCSSGGISHIQRYNNHNMGLGQGMGHCQEEAHLQSDCTGWETPTKDSLTKVSSNMISQQTPATLHKQPSRQRKVKGTFSKYLHSTRVSIEADCARLRSGSYPYRPLEMRRHDVNDPRNRADTIMDVTIVGHPVPSESEVEMAVVMGFIHQFMENEHKLKTIRMPGRSRRVCHETSHELSVESTTNTATAIVEKPLLLPLPTYAWLCFRRDTYADLGIVQGTQLRIYNPQRIPMGESSFSIVVCTRLCEIYPSCGLPPLACDRDHTPVVETDIIWSQKDSISYVTSLCHDKR